MFNKQRGEYPSKRNQNVNLSKFLLRQDTAYFIVITDNILQFKKRKQNAKDFKTVFHI